MLDLVFPPRCAACDAAGGWPLCEGCTDGVGVISPPWCVCCGRPTEEPVARCPDCPPDVIDGSRAPFLYDGAIADGIKAVKFAGMHGLCEHLAAAMAAAVERCADDLITWVPLSRRRRSHRGFDQAELLARALAKRLDLPVKRLLARRRDARSMARRTGAERRQALQGAFRVVGRDVPRQVLLVDDVLTTGSTAAACAAVLKEAGAERVQLGTAARSLGGPVPARCRALASVP